MKPQKTQEDQYFQYLVKGQLKNSTLHCKLCLSYHVSLFRHQSLASKAMRT